MKPYILIPIIIGGVLLTAGAIILPIAIVSNANTARVETREVVIEDSFKNINVNVDTTDFELKASTDGNSKFVIKETEKDHHEVKVENETLFVTYKDERRWYEHVFTGWNSLKVTAYIPVEEYNDLTYKCSTGDINIDSGFTFDSVNINVSTGNCSFKSNVKNDLVFKASTGNSTFDSLTAKNLSATASTGRITLRNVNIEERINLKASTGNVIVENTKATDFESNTSTGKITLTNTVISNHIQIKASTGDVKFNDSDANTLNITTSTGDVKGTLLTSKVFYVKTDTGKINVPKSTEGGLCEINTDTGDISISIKA